MQSRRIVARTAGIAISSLAFVVLGATMQFARMQAAEATAQTGPETVLERKVHLEAAIHTEIPQVPPLCDALPGLSKQRVDLGDVTLYCEEEGTGIPVVLLHGGPGATHHEFHPAFSRAKGARIIYYDQRGCGRSEYKSGKGYSIEQSVDDLHRLRQALKLAKWVVLGHSFGGALAQCYAVKYPEDLAGLILVCSGEAAPLKLSATRQYDFISKEELLRIREVHQSATLSEAQRVYNAFLNGDWKRQLYYRPTREDVARTALYGWKHDDKFRGPMCADLRKYDLGGAFDACPIPTLIVESKWDLTWNTDKPAQMQRMLPRARLVLFEQSGHLPFSDEPEKFFGLVGDFLRDLAPVSAAEVSAWKGQLAAWKAQRERSPAYLLQTTGYGRASNEKIAKHYSPQWLDQLNDTGLLLKIGFALYDVKKYEEALLVFRRLSDRAARDKVGKAMALVWQGQVLDLLGRREEAVSVYTKAVELKVNLTLSHDQFDLRYSPSSYAAERLKEPFTRKENRQTD
jgi:proline iminopeptidase